MEQHDDRRRIEALTGPDEHVLWTGRPDPTKHFTRSDLWLVPFSLLWTGFMVFWLFGVGGSDAPAFSVLWGSAFVLVGLYLVVGRFVVKALRKRRTTYGLTTRRAIVLVGDSRVEDSPLVGQPVTVERSRDGRHATVLVGSGSPSPFGLGPSFANTGWPMSSSVAFGFFDVPDPDPMLRALEEARRPARR